MAKVTFDYSKANLFIREHEMESMKDIVLAAKDKLLARTGACLLYTSDAADE